MPKIRILDENIANKIAAGEVVERPLSVVKELVENALDAGATRISVDIKDGGTSSITVSDNGCGIEPEDAALAFSRHATSKISRVEDLLGLSSLGFRGEALPSIASIAKVTLISRVQQRDEGIKLVIEGGSFLEESPTGCPTGTKITVEKLFYNTPARKKHLKSPSAEAGLISDLLTRLALSRSDVSFKLTSQKRVLMETPGTDKLIDTIASVHGLNVAKGMIPITGETAGLHISGYVSKPELNRATRSQQTIYINGRYVKSRLISDALQEGYHTLLSSKRYPAAVIAVETAPGMVDVNVHPAKMEVRISRERELYKLLVSAVQKAVRTPKIVPLIEPTLNHQENKSSEIKEHVYQSKDMHQDYGNQTKFNFTKQKFAGNKTHNYSTDKPKNGEKIAGVEVSNTNALNNDEMQITKQMFREKHKCYNTVECIDFPELLPLGQLMPTYILAQGAEGLYIIDQHAAHERVLYEWYLKDHDCEHSSQMLLVPVVLELGFHEYQVLTENIIKFRRLGFILEHFGDTTYMLRGVPVDFPQGEETKFFYDVLDTTSTNFYDLLAAKLACRSAIKSGQKMSIDEMNTLLQQMSDAETPYSCPHGRPTIINLSFDDLAKRFKR
ncbi:MAG: DNA mismatch repair endonuclease MutL [Firmicutes bacterium]|nr:DNA mismatch repair endonuclease MutL [Bacillota bacterium]